MRYNIVPYICCVQKLIVTLKTNIMKTELNLTEVKNILDNANWNYEYCGDLGSNTENAINYLETQKFSLSKINEFKHLIENEDIENSEMAANYLADALAWDRISKYVWSQSNRGEKKWAVSDSTSFKIN